MHTTAHEKGKQDMAITREAIEKQLRKDREAVEAMSPELREHLKLVVDRIRTPSHTNFSDPEAL